MTVRSRSASRRAALLVAASLALAPIYPAFALEANAPKPVGERIVQQQTPIDVPQDSFTGPDGKEITLADFKGKTVLLNFWATWCAPCVEEMPSLNRLQASRGNDKFVVVALSSDRGGKDKVAPFYKERGIDALGMYLDQPNKLAKSFKLRGLPTTVIINGEGKEVGRLEGSAAWDSAEAANTISRLASKPPGAD